MIDRDGWVKLRVGCHWTKGPFTVSTTRMGDGSRSGYVLVRDRRVLAEFISWEEVNRIVEDWARREGLEHDKGPSRPV